MKLPPAVTLIEVGPRDGFQNIEDFIPTEVKLAVIKELIASGIKEIELTSFVSPKAISQMADAREVVSEISDMTKSENYKKIVLVPNLRGAEEAFSTGIKTISFVISASESHNRANVNQTIEESFLNLKNIIEALPELTVRLDIATSFGCPFEGDVPQEHVLEMVKRGLETGVGEIVLCDTIGVANPKQVDEICSEAIKIVGDKPLTLHFHDTRGLGIANVLAALQCGVTRFEAAVGGLGGCPFAPGAAGNIAMEDLLQLMISMGIETGIERDTYINVVELVKEKIKLDLSGHMSYARIY